MIYLLDTNTCIRYITGRSRAISDRFHEIPRRDIRLCDIVKGEMYYGVYKSLFRESNLALYREFFGEFESLPFDSAAADIYGGIRANLERRGTLIGPYDLQIAAIALANNLILVTHNTREFSRVEALRLDDWER